jgi:predicted phage tail protein
MFGKTRDINDTDTLDSSAIDEFFGDEAAAATSVEIHDLRDRVDQVESQINSQFTSLATYAQIAQEQVELARAEARAATERSEQRVTSLIERERADRITSYTGEAPGSSPDITARLDALEHSVARIQQGLDESRQQQKDLAQAISAMFDTLTASAPRSASLPAPTPASAPTAPLLEPPAAAANIDADGPISGLAFDS